MFSKEAIKLAKPLVEAIKKIAERQEKRCSKCNGKGRIWKDGKALNDQRTEVLPQIQCDKCKGTGKVKGKWEWEPEVGEWCVPQGVSILSEKRIYLIWAISTEKDLSIVDNFTEFEAVIKPSEGIPLLHWEKIEEILEGMGYSMIVSHPLDCPKRRHGYLCMIWHKDWADDKEIEYIGDKRQTAVMRKEE